jgi:hypothetical protein
LGFSSELAAFEDLRIIVGGFANNTNNKIDIEFLKKYWECNGFFKLNYSLFCWRKNKGR